MASKTDTATAAISKDSGGLRLTVYPGDNKILIAMSLDDSMVDEQAKNLAGFAVSRKIGNAVEAPLLNRISFEVGVSNATTAETREWTPSNEAPFQKFRWVDVPPEGFTEDIAYRVKALYFKGQTKELSDGPEVSITVSPVKPRHKKFRPAFTRGYIASQAYADKFGNKDIRPKGAKTPDFDTAPFEAQYAWLGADARTALFDFIKDCEDDKQCLVDLFAYDFDEPDVIAAVCRMGKEGRLRAILDNAPLHSKASKSGTFPIEVDVAKMVIAAAGADKVRQGHFQRYQHNKVFIKRDVNGAAQRVIFGSMNFSVRGVYVQSNNVIVADDPATAAMFAKAFDVAFADDVAAPLFRQNPISQAYMTGSAEDTADLPKFSLALSPHTDWSVSLGPMTERIRNATSSVLYAVMAPTGGGPVLASLREIAAEPAVFSYGTVETDKGLAVQSPDGAMGDRVSFAALIKNVPPNFRKEIDGGMGMHIHDKFVVVDFNAGNPTVFTGSSNLASGGEEQNGDSLVMIEDPAIATMYAIEALAIFDHYHFRKAMQGATKAEPLTLWFPGKPGQPAPWWKSYYDPKNIHLRDRCLFANVPLPKGLETVKNVDWKSVDSQDAKSSGGSGQAKAASGRAPAKKAAAGARRAPAKSPRKAAAKTAPRAPTKTAARKAAAKKSTATKRKAPAKKAPAKKGAVKKAAVKKSPAKKVSARKTARKSAPRGRR